MSPSFRTPISFLSLLLCGLFCGLLWVGLPSPALAADGAHAPGVSITGETEVIAGAPIHYTLQISNSTGMTLTQLLLQQTLPPGVALDGCSIAAPNTGACITAGGAVTITLNGALAPGAGAAAAVTVATSPAAEGSLVSSVVLSARDPQGDELPTVTAAISTLVAPAIPAPTDFTFTVDNGLTHVQPARSATYQLTITNNGTAAASEVRLQDLLPEGTVFVSATSGGSETAPGSGIVVWPPFDLPGQATVSRSVVVRAEMPWARTATQIVNRASFSYAGLAPAPNLEAEDADTVLTSIMGGLVWRDLDGSGRFAAGEPGIAGVGIAALYAGADDSFESGDEVALHAVTDAGGRYTLIGLAAGRYRLQIESPWPGGVEVSVDPEGAPDGIATVAVNTGQSLSSLNFGYPASDLQVTKAHDDEKIVPGAALTYHIIYANIGSAAAEKTALTETVPANARFDVGGSAPGWSCENEGSAGSRCHLPLGRVEPAAGGLISFTVILADAMPSRVDAITNTVEIADLTPGSLDAAPASNRFTLASSVEAAPLLRVTQTDGGARTEPGRTLVYTTTYSNIGNQGAAGVRILQTVPPNSRFQAAASSPGWSCDDNSPAGTLCAFTIGDLPANSTGSLLFALAIDAAMPVNVATIDAQVTIVDERGDTANDTELTPVDASPDLVLGKIDSPPVVQAGQLIRYTLVFSNTGNQNAIGVLIVDTVPDYTTFSAANSSPGWSCPDGSAAGTNCIFSIGALNAGQGGEVVFAVSVDQNLVPGAGSILNRAVIAGSGIELDILNNQSGSSVDVLDPTAIDLLSFTAVNEKDGMRLTWVTGAEYGSWGFILHRSTNTSWQNAVRITPSLIDAVGNEQAGTTYSFLDTTALLDMDYVYWLQELELDGGTNVFGPLRVRRFDGIDPSLLINRVYLPTVMAEGASGE